METAPLHALMADLYEEFAADLTAKAQACESPAREMYLAAAADRTDRWETAMLEALEAGYVPPMFPGVGDIILAPEPVEEVTPVEEAPDEWFWSGRY